MLNNVQKNILYEILRDLIVLRNRSSFFAQSNVMCVKQLLKKSRSSSDSIVWSNKRNMVFASLSLLSFYKFVIVCQWCGDNNCDF